MKLFSSDRYTKPGKGIEKDAKQKRPIFRFFEILWQKKYKLIGLNLIYVLFNLISVAVVFFVFSGAVGLYGMFAGGTEWISDFYSSASASLYYRFLVLFIIILTSVPVFAVGPFQAGFTYILKSFVKEEPCFLWHDFIAKSRANRKLGIQVGLINGLIGAFLIINASAYLVISDPNGAYAGAIPFFIEFLVALVIIACMVLLIMMNLYIYHIMVTFRVTLKQLYKNAFILVLVKWLPNVGILLLETVLAAIPPFLIMSGYFTYIVPLLLYVFITPALFGFINNFYVYPTIKKYMIDNPKADKSGSSGEADNESKEEAAAVSGGKFENGMWIEE
ncbi:MAG: hypothetical protein IJZ90_02540 [Clostridia bacterium]|nr:hypothetical protein [Clostridia bacterium]